MAKEKFSKKDKEEIKQEVKKLTRAQLAKERARRHAREFKEEFNKAITTAFIAAFGFLIALIWRDLITEYVNKISESSPVQGKLFSALIVTLICVIGIMILTKLFSEKKVEEKNN
jgi:hypothetical protein